MGKDFRPCDMHHCLKAVGKTALELAKSAMILEEGSGQKPACWKPTYTDETLAFMEKYPHLGESAPDETASLSGKAAETVLERVDAEIGRIMENEGSYIPEQEWIRKWYFGELDPKFYYSDYNNKLFLAHIRDEVKKEEERLQDAARPDGIEAAPGEA